MLKNQVYAKTDIGKIRLHNEDAVNIYRIKNCTVMVVADGMGGHEAGDIASQMVIESIERNLTTCESFQDAEMVRRWIKDVLYQINQDILNYIEMQEITHGMGTTVVIAMITGPFIAFAHIGDSRAYILAHKQLRQVTKDHTFVRDLVDKGQLSERAARFHPHRNIIMNALGVSRDLKFDYLILENYDLDAILLCSDGLTSMLDDSEILQVLIQKGYTEEKVDLLIEIANQNGGHDNISVALCEFGERSDY